MTDEHFVTREECQRIHNILDESRKTNIAEGKKDRDSLRERYDVGLKWVIGLFVTFLLGVSGIMLQNWQRASAVYETRNLAREFVARVEVMDEKVDRIEVRQIRTNDEVKELSTDLKAHTKATKDSTKELQKQIRDKNSMLELEIPDFSLAMKHGTHESEKEISIDDIGRVEHEQALRDVVIKLYVTPHDAQAQPAWRAVTREE